MKPLATLWNDDREGNRRNGKKDESKREGREAGRERRNASV
jgi:hypothetical protein